MPDHADFLARADPTATLGGIGRAVTRAFAAEGARVAVTWHSDKDDAERLAAAQPDTDISYLAHGLVRSLAWQTRGNDILVDVVVPALTLTDCIVAHVPVAVRDRLGSRRPLGHELRPEARQVSRWDGQVSHAYEVKTLVSIVILTHRDRPCGRNSLVLSVRR